MQQREKLIEIDFDLDDIEKNIFFTREEAEKALAKREVKTNDNL